MRALLLGLVASVAGCAAPIERAEGPAAPQAPAPAEALGDALERRLLTTIRVRGEPAYETLAGRMEELRIPGLSIAVFDDHEIVWTGTYGVSDLDGGEPVRDTTLFQAGSISKSVNALAVMLVAADGTFDLDSPINDIVHSWKLPDNELTQATPVTLRHLLSHTGGTTVHGFPGYPDGAPVPTLEQVLDGAPPANTAPVRVDIRPGSRFRYSGGGTTITQLALVDTLDAAYPEILSKRVLAPLGMVNSTYEQPLPAARLKQAAAGHHRDGTVVPGRRHVYPEMAAAGLWTTATDLATFFVEITLALEGRSEHVPTAVAEAMTTAVDEDSGAALGFFVARLNGVRLFSHNGADEGFQAFAMASREGGYGLVVMGNSDNVLQLAPAIQRTVFAAMNWPAADPPISRVALAPAERDRWVGSFGVEGHAPFSIKVTGERLVLAEPFLDEVELVPVATNGLVRVDNGLRLTRTEGDNLEFSNHERVVETAARQSPSALTPLLDLAAGDFDVAVAAWKELARTDPAAAAASEAVALDHAIRLVFSSRLESALIVLRAATTAFPDSAEGFARLAYARAVHGEPEAAAAALDLALEKLETDPRIPREQKAAWRTQAEAEFAKILGPRGER